MEIEINLKNVSKEEIEELKKYLEENCWDWKQNEVIMDKKKSKAQREKEKAELIQELGYDPDRDPLQDHWDHESDKIAIQKEFHENETS